MITVTIEGVKPSPRFDGHPWTSYKIEESISKNGPWSDILVGNLIPVDTDPTNPAVRNFTADTDMVDGWYRVAFVDANAAVEVTIPRWNHDSACLAYLPTVDQVARKIMSRCRDQYGNQVGSFTPTTTPTDDQVEDLIFDVVTNVADVIGDTIPDELLDDAQQVVALAAAMRIETDFFSDQVNTGRSIHPQLEAEYESQLARLQRQVTIANEGGAVADSGPSLKPSGSFPSVSDTNGDWLTRRM